MGALVFTGVEDVRSVFDQVYTMPYGEFGDMLDEAFACTPVGAFVNAEGRETGSVYALSDVLDLMVDPLFDLAEREGDERDVQNATAYMTVVQDVRELERVALVITSDTSVGLPLMSDEMARMVLGLWADAEDLLPLGHEMAWMRVAALIGKAIASAYMQNIFFRVYRALEHVGVVADATYWMGFRVELFTELYCSKIPMFPPSTRVA